MATITLSPSLGTLPSAPESERLTALEQQVQFLMNQLKGITPSPALSTDKSMGEFLSRGRLPPTPGLDSPAASSLQSKEGSPVRKTPADIAAQILSIIQRYGQNTPVDKNVQWAGRAKFEPAVERYVVNDEPVRMILPAFPFKSPNRSDKTLGALPDLGEELALQHLNGLCDSITEVYQPGATVIIASDGIVYNDLMGVSDADVWEYSTTIRKIVANKDLKFIETIRILDLLDQSTENLDREEYLMHANCYRREMFAKHTPAGFDARDAVKNDKNINMTYKGYIKFLTKDLAHSHLAEESKKAENPKRWYKSAIEELAYKMITRGKAFAAAIEKKYGNYVRLSIHPSDGQLKLSVPLIPQPKGMPNMTPWHSSIAVAKDGTFRTVHAEEVRDTHELVHQNGRPYFFREKADFYNLGAAVEIEPMYPCGVIIRPAAGTRPSFRALDSKALRELTNTQSPVVLRGFGETLERELYINKAHELGKVLPWTFGVVQEVKDHKRDDKSHNNVVSNEAMPMHYDGMFKLVNKKDENGNDVLDEEGKPVKYNAPPGFQYFTCPAAAPKGEGYTLFAASRLFWRNLPATYTVNRLEKVKWRMDNDGFWDAKLKSLPLVVRHPVHDTPCLRWHEPWGSEKTKFSTCAVTIENESQDIADVVTQLLYDRRVCLRFTWEAGDMLLSDNTLMLHTRTAFSRQYDRELWRIHFD